ncbi:MAG TPA: AraC family transcriptional regulator [Thermoanaerobaculia bacterium]|nr:AraC family transcriptional regulator [Thermoanaerobaculia bacterium]
MSLDEFHVIELTVAAGVYLETHRHPRAAITLTLEGHVEETTPFGTRPLTAGSLDYRPPGLPHSNLFGPFGCHMLAIDIASDRMARFEPLFERPYDPAPFQLREFGDLPARIRQELHAVDRYGALGLRAAILELVARGSRLIAGGAEPPSWLAEAYDYIQRRFHEPIALADVARHVGLDPVPVARGYKRFFAQTVGDAIRSVRVARTAELLLATDVTVAEIAACAGFYDASHLIRSFQAVKGCTPSQFRSGGERAARQRSTAQYVR